jgi:hypothetical protein
MYFGTLVTRARDDQEQDTWRREMDASAPAAPGRWRMLLNALHHLFHHAA